MDNENLHRVFHEGEELFARLRGDILFKLYLYQQEYVEYEYHVKDNKILNVKTCDIEYVLNKYGDQINLKLP
ncbi:MAG: hypothetical protein C0592_00245 [Marinilabiliales bacterium]|nr:MAG: hypothetical protein C0592_00245 [Marinilabiliales bacterium]